MGYNRHYLVNGKKIDILKEDWDFLVLLDACRYDYFKEVYRNHFHEGSLKKAISPSTWTMEWLNKIFEDNYFDDIIYISPHPFINSKKEITFKDSFRDNRSFDGKKHFFKVIDVWRGNTINVLDTIVHPITVNRAFHKTYLKYPNKRYIIHYIQPHRPYITINDKVKVDYTPFERLLTIFFSPVQMWSLKRFLNKPSTSALEDCYRKNGKDGIIEVYKNEIGLVLDNLKMLIDSISGNWLITADHGERIANFWRFNSFEHGGRRDREVIEVPWFEIKKREVT
jgi:hypothetical protein